MDNLTSVWLTDLVCSVIALMSAFSPFTSTTVTNLLWCCLNRHSFLAFTSEIYFISVWWK